MALRPEIQNGANPIGVGGPGAADSIEAPLALGLGGPIFAQMQRCFNKTMIRTKSQTFLKTLGSGLPGWGLGWGFLRATNFYF